MVKCNNRRATPRLDTAGNGTARNRIQQNAVRVQRRIDSSKTKESWMFSFCCTGWNSFFTEQQNNWNEWWYAIKETKNPKVCRSLSERIIRQSTAAGTGNEWQHTLCPPFPLCLRLLPAYRRLTSTNAIPLLLIQSVKALFSIKTQTRNVLWYNTTQIKASVHSGFHG